MQSLAFPLRRMLRRLFRKKRPSECASERVLHLPFTPEDLPSMRARWRQALWPICDFETFIKNPALAYHPSHYRRHSFDIVDGFRFVISLDRLRGELVLHISFGCLTEEAAALLGTMTKSRVIMRAFISDVTGIRVLPYAESITAALLHWYFRPEVLWD